MVGFALDSQAWKHKQFLNSMMSSALWEWVIVAFPNHCWARKIITEHSTKSLWTSLSVLFFLGHTLLPLALQHGRDLKCHSEWPPPHLWKLRWRETGAPLSFFASPSACSFSLSVWALKVGTFTNLLRPPLKGEKHRFIISAVPIMNRIPLGERAFRLDTWLIAFLSRFQGPSFSCPPLTNRY